MQISGKKRIAVLLLVAAVCFAMLFSAFFLAANARHNCCGEDCAICAQIALCENILKATVLTVSAAAVTAVVFVGSKQSIAAPKKSTEKNTLIALRVELLN